MKRELIYLLLAAGVIFSGGLPFVSRDVGELRPVQTALIRMEEEQVILETDLGDRGIGTDWSSAMADLEAKAPGAVFIGTASFLLLEDGASALLPELAKQTELNPGRRRPFRLLQLSSWGRRPGIGPCFWGWPPAVSGCVWKQRRFMDGGIGNRWPFCKFSF